MRWIARLVLVLCLIVAAYYCLLHTRLVTARQLGFSMQMSMYLAGFATFALVVPGWLLIWRGMVRWTPVRKLTTGIVAASAQPAGFALGLLISGGDRDFGWFLCAILPTLLFVIGTTAAWIPLPTIRRRAAADAIDVPCPDCGYNLRGLREARCPECGGEFMLEQLVVAKKS